VRVCGGTDGWRLQPGLEGCETRRLSLSVLYEGLGFVGVENLEDCEGREEVFQKWIRKDTVYGSDEATASVIHNL
jgi:hypothetical protein